VRWISLEAGWGVYSVRALPEEKPRLPKKTRVEAH